MCEEADDARHPDHAGDEMLHQEGVESDQDADLNAAGDEVEQGSWTEQELAELRVPATPLGTALLAEDECRAFLCTLAAGGARDAEFVRIYDSIDYRLLLPVLRSYFRSTLLLNDADINDALQDIWLRVYRTLKPQGHFDPHDIYCPTGWLRLYAKRVALDALKRHKIRRGREGLFTDAGFEPEPHGVGGSRDMFFKREDNERELAFQNCVEEQLQEYASLSAKAAIEVEIVNYVRAHCYKDGDALFAYYKSFDPKIASKNAAQKRLGLLYDKLRPHLDVCKDI